MHESDELIKREIITQLKGIIKKYAKPRLTETVEVRDEEIAITQDVQDYNLSFSLTKRGVFQKDFYTVFEEFFEQN